jgi:hypothetical protein
VTGTQYAGWISGNPPRDEDGGRRAPRVVSRGVLTILTVLVGLFGGLGWIYALRAERWLGAGPRIPDSLPLLQLARFDGQPLERVMIAWLGSGLICGLVLVRVSRPARGTTAAVLATGLLALDAQASYALTRNLRFAAVLWSHPPGLGPWLEAGLFTVAVVLPGSGRRPREDHRPFTLSPLSSPSREARRSRPVQRQGTGRS